MDLQFEKVKRVGFKKKYETVNVGNIYAYSDRNIFFKVDKFENILMCVNTLNNIYNLNLDLDDIEYIKQS